MAHLTMDAGLDMNKVTISLWFRIPQETVDAVRAQTGGWDVMYNVVPLLTWGEQQSYTHYYGEEVVFYVYDPDPEHEQRVYEVHGQAIRSDPNGKKPPSYIGVYVGSTEKPVTPALEVRIQTADRPVPAQTAQSAVGAHNPEILGIPWVIDYETVSVEWHPQNLGNASVYVFGTENRPTVEIDQWNHLLISWDIVDHSNKSGAAKMWCAINDKNKNGDDLPARRPDEAKDRLGPNDHVADDLADWFDAEDALYSISFGKIPSTPFSIPAPPLVSEPPVYLIPGRGTFNPIEKVEMAELQIFTGMALDTSLETNRRAFVDKDGLPVNPAKAEELMGKRPEVLLHGSTNWQEGKNTGSLGVEINSDGASTDIPSGQFTHQGSITKYTPDPQLEHTTGG